MFIDVIIPIPLPQLFTYRIPEEDENVIDIGKRVVVQFGSRRYYSALVVKIHNNEPKDYKTKNITSVLDDTPIVNEKQFKFWNWISEYYMCSIGEVYKAALPSGLKLESETKILFNPDFSDYSSLSAKESLIVSVLESRNVLSFNDINEIASQKNSLLVIKSLFDKGGVILEEKLKDTYKPKVEIYINLNEDYSDEKSLNELLDKLGRAPKQQQLLMSYLNISNHFNSDASKEVQRRELLKSVNISSGILNSLIKKGVFVIYEKEISRLFEDDKDLEEIKSLNIKQTEALKQIKENFETKDVNLLFGVTSSGKTEIYIHLIEEYINKGKQVLYLLPEIALTTQIIVRLKKVFGNKVGIYHSKHSDAERVEVWNSIVEGKGYQIILGVRSSVFLPFHNLGLIIVDEEHENTYKQFDPNPRYNARDASMVLAKLHGAKVLLGTATPAIETYYNAKSGKYGLVELKHRYMDIKLPEILIADVKQAKFKKKMVSFFTPLLLEHITTALNNDEQVILFQNRRGFSPFIECDDCGWVPKCRHCDVSLTYHKFSDTLVCHYCGYTTKAVKKCGECGNQNITDKGFGTEKIEEEVQLLFKDAKVARLDMDTTRSKKSYEKIISKFETGDLDILIGTQMISKGLDFDKVSVVGILNADNMLNFPDFRAFERSFQLMMQVSGRAGRRGKRGKVIIQTSDHKHPIIHNVIRNDYMHMYEVQQDERKLFKYPPFYRLVRITLKHRDNNVLNDAARLFSDELRKIFGNRILGPEQPLINRIQNLYLKNVLIKLEREAPLNKSKSLISHTVKRMLAAERFKNVSVVIDVDPV